MASTFGVTRLQRMSTADQVVEVLRNKIMGGELRSGTSMQEIPLASAIGVSRNTVREAFRTLLADGLLRKSVNKSVAVAFLSEDDVTEIYRIRNLVELAAVDAVCTKGEVDFGRMQEAISELKTAALAGDWLTLVDKDMTFHCLLVSAIGSSRLQQFYGKLLSELRLALVITDQKSGQFVHQIPKQHQQLLESLMSGSHEKCRQILAKHLAESERRVKGLLQEHQKRLVVSVNRA